jgi:hypothetical protein
MVAASTASRRAEPTQRQFTDAVGRGLKLALVAMEEHLATTLSNVPHITDPDKAKAERLEAIDVDAFIEWLRWQAAKKGAA